jgi:3-hydroxybutyryl-CoA dehydratase
MDAAASEQSDLVLGQCVERLFLIDDEQVRAFAAVSGDHNPLHLDDAYARKTVFRGRVAHGMLLGAHISAVLGDTLPGPGAIYLSQTLEFEHPVRIPSEVKVHVEVVELGEHRRTTLATTCSVGDQVVARGWAVVIPPKARKARPGA